MARHAAPMSPLNTALEAMLGAVHTTGTFAITATLAATVPFIATTSDVDTDEVPREVTRTLQAVKA